MTDFSAWSKRKDWGTTVGTQSLIPRYRERRDHARNLLEKRELLAEPLLPLQRKSVANAAALKYHALCDDMGLGKTAQALAVDALGGHEKTLILCPSNVKKVWVNEIQKFLGLKQKHIYVGKGREFVDMHEKVTRHFRFFVFNYEVLNVADKTPDVVPPLLKICTHHILDEVHAMRNAEAKKSLYYDLMLRRHPPDSLSLLTGTPIDRFIGELYVYLSLLDKNPHTANRNALEWWFPNAISFADRYGMASDRSGTTASVRNYSGFRKDDGVCRELYDLMGPRFCQRKIEEVVSLPEKHGLEHHIPDASFTHLDMEQVREDFKRAFIMANKNRMGRKRWQKVQDNDTDGGIDSDTLFMAQTQRIRRQLAEGKVPFTLGLAAQRRQQLGPGVVFSEFLSPLDLFKANMERNGRKCLLAVGQGRMPLWERDQNIKHFKDGKADFLLATYGAMSEGENLQQFRSLMYNDLSWQPLVMKQSERRIWRLGQTQEVTVDTMLCSADETIQGTLERKEEMIVMFEYILSEIKKNNDLGG